VKYAGIINDEGRAIGRSGMGAIMGSKKLKAIAIHGINRVQIADSAIGKQLLKEDADAKRKDLLKTLTPFLFTLYGTNCYLDMGMALGDTPGYYFTRNEFFADKLTGKTLREEYPVLDYGCWGCTMRCGKTTIIEHEGKEIKVDGPEYESVSAFGPLLGVFDSKTVILSNHMCNVCGFDTISGGVSIAFLIWAQPSPLTELIQIVSNLLIRLGSPAARLFVSPLPLPESALALANVSLASMTVCPMTVFSALKS